MKQILIYLLDQEYGERFTKYLQKRPDLGYEVISVNNEEQMTLMLEAREFAVVITDCDEELYIQLQQQVIKIIQITAKKELIEDQEIAMSENKIYFYKYQSMENLLPYLLPVQAEVHAKNKNKIMHQKQSIITIFLPESSSNLIEEAHRIAEEIYTLSKRQSLYLSMCPFDVSLGTKKGGGIEELRHGMSDVVYYLNEKECQIRENRQLFVKEDRSLEYILPFNHCLDLLEMSQQQVSELFPIIYEWEYETIVVAVSMITEATLQIIRRSNYILWLCHQEKSSKQEKLIQEQLEKVGVMEEKQTIYRFVVNDSKEMNARNHKELKRILGGCDGAERT